MVLFKLFDVIDVRMADILDILLVSIILYYVFLLFRGTRAVQMSIGIIALVILFQPEIRSALTRIGQTISRADLRQLFFHSSGLDDVTESITSAVQDLAKNHVGALIVLEKRVGLRNYEETGEILNARISSRLLRALFFPNSALHDGAVLLNSHSIVAAGCILPMPTGNIEGDAGYGMRHRAAKALAAECDAMVIVVSEETGGISIAYRNSLRRKLSIKELEAEIKRHWAELFHRPRIRTKTKKRRSLR